MPNVEIIVPAGAGTGAVADLRVLKADRSFMFTAPAQSGVQVEVSGDGVRFVPVKTLLLQLASGNIPFNSAAPFARAVRPNNGVAGAVYLSVSADQIDVCTGGCGDPACQATVSGGTNTVGAETAVAATFVPPGDGTYTISWRVTGRENATGAIIGATVTSYYKVIGGAATKIGADITLTDVDEPTGFGAPDSVAAGGNINLRVTGKALSPATWVIGGCVQVNQGVAPPP